MANWVDSLHIYASSRSKIGHCHKFGDASGVLLTLLPTYVEEKFRQPLKTGVSD
jgi:hypothetical protein